MNHFETQVHVLGMPPCLWNAKRVLCLKQLKLWVKFSPKSSCNRWTANIFITSQQIPAETQTWHQPRWRYSWKKKKISSLMVRWQSGQIFRMPSLFEVPQASPMVAPSWDSAPGHLVPGAPWALRPKGSCCPCATEKARWGAWLLIKRDLFSKLDRYLFSHCENPDISGSCHPELETDLLCFPSPLSWNI